jgi:hypothetical protein
VGGVPIHSSLPMDALQYLISLLEDFNLCLILLEEVLPDFGPKSQRSLVPC